MKPRQSPSAAATLKNFLAFVLVVVILCIGGLLFLAFQKLPAYASSVNQKLKAADLVSDHTSGGSQLEKRASLYFAPAENFSAQARTDILAYASLVQLSAPNVSVADNTAHTLSVDFKTPVEYTKFVQFLSAIEANTPKLTVTTLEMTRTTNASVSINKLLIKVETR